MSEATSTSNSTPKKKSEPNQKAERVLQEAPLTPHVKIVVSNVPLVLPDDAEHRSIKGINSGQKTGLSIAMTGEALVRSMRFSVAKKEKKYVVTLSLPLEQDQPTGKPPHLRYELGSFRSEKKAQRYMQHIQYETLTRLTQGIYYKPMKRWCENAVWFAVGGVLAAVGTVAIMSVVSNMYSTHVLSDMYYDYDRPSYSAIEPAALTPIEIEPEVTYLPHVDQSRLIQLSELNQKNIELVAEVAGIEIEKKTPNATPFYVFSRLNCEGCDTVNRILADVAPEFQAVVLPAAFENDLQSAQSIAYAYCAENPGQAWVDIANDKTVDSSLLCNWAEKAQVTSKLADLLAIAEHPDDWPLIVAPNGKVSRGSFPSDPAVATRMLNEHLNLNLK